MTKPHTKADAFRLAQLKSERLRILLIIAVVITILAFRILGTILVINDDSLRIVIEGTVFAAIFIGVELLILLDVQRAIKGGPDVPRSAWLGSLIFESLLPAIALAFLTSTVIDFHYRPLAHAAALWFFIIIILTTQRLNPVDYRIAGLVAAVSYLLAAFIWDGGLR
jgi:hypothetical protein